MKRLLVFLLMCLMLQTHAQQISIFRTDVAPVIDGSSEEAWNIASQQNINLPFKTETPTVTATWQAMYDDNNFYLILTVDDDNHWPNWESGGDSWLFDGPEVYWDVNEILNDGIGSGSGNGHYQSANGFADGGYGIEHTLVGGNINPGGTFAYSLVGEGYIYEIAVPWANLKDKDANAINSETSHPIGFDVTIIDQDEGITTSRHRAVWTNDGNGNNGSTDESWNNMDGCGTIILAEASGISKTKVFLTYQENSRDTVFVNSIESWNATTSDTWISVNPSTGIGNGFFVISASENLSTKRIGTVTFSCTGKPDKTIIITQYPRYEITPGNLASMLGGDLSTTKILSLTGTIDARDFKTMRDNMPLLETVDLNGVSIVEYSGTEGTSIWGNTFYAANEVPQHGFNNKSSLKSITLPESATLIRDNAFSGCINLSSISLPSSITEIMNGAFYDCDKIVSFDIPSGVTAIRSSTLSYCDNLETVNIPSTVTTIGVSAFNGSNKLRDIFIPSSVTSIGENAFRGSTGPFTVDAANAYFASPDGVLYNKDLTTLVQYPRVLTGNYTIPTSVTSIGFGAFGNISSISSITIPEGVTAIYGDAFFNCTNLTSVVIPSTVNYIGNNAFEYSYSLDSIYSYSVTPTDLSGVNNVFDGIDKINCTLFVAYGSASAYRAANQWGDFTDIVEIDGFYPSATSVAFSNMASTKKLYIGSSVSWSAESSESWLTISPESAPGSDSLSIAVEQNTGDPRTATITLHPDGLPDKTITITQYGITLVTAGNLAAVLGEQLTYTKTLTLSGTIDARDFKTMRDNMPLLEEIDLSGISIVEYSGTEGTSNWGNPFYAANEVPQHGLFSKSSIKSITLPESATTISDFAFSGCINLSFVGLPTSLTEIRQGAFNDCDRLVSFVIPEGLTAIRASTFWGCNNLETITIPSTVTTIEGSAFTWSNKLRDIFIPSSVTSIGDNAFRGCTGPFTVDAANTYYSSPDGVLFNKDCTVLVQYPGSRTGNYTIPSSVTTIGYGAFGGISTISSMSIPEGVTAINSEAFQYCSNLTSVVIPSTVKYISNNAFAYSYSLDSIYSYALTPVDLSTVNNVFDGIDKTNCTLFVLFGSASAYRAANQWGDFTDIAEIDGFYPSATSVAFSNMASTQKLFIGSSVSWSAESSESWLTISPESAPGSDSLTIAVEQNTGDSRTATITLHPDGLPDKTISVTQYGITLVTAGNLAAVLGDDLSTTKELSLSGTIDARDFKTMRDNMPLLEVIDLSGVSIVEYSGTEGTSNWGNNNYLANEVPQHGLYYKSSLKSITLPESVTRISDFALAGCINLSFVGLPTSLTEIRQGAFNDCDRIVSFVIPEGVTTIQSSTFVGCDNLETITIPSTVTTIEGSAFTWSNKLRDIFIPSTVTSIGDNAFRGCTGPFTVDAANTYYSSPDGVLFNKDCTVLVQYPGSRTGNYTIPSSVTTIGYGAFAGISTISSMSIPDGVTSISSEAFYSCPYLTTVVIPSTVSYIGHNSFAYSNLLDSIYSYALTPVDLSTVNNVFDGIDKTNCTLFVPFGSASAYRSANQWGDFTDIVEIDGFYPSATSVAFSNMASTIKLFIGSSVSWSAESSESWLTISPLSAPGSDSLTIAVEQNTGETRTATITLHPDGMPDKTITITQYGITLVTAGNLAAVLGEQLAYTKTLTLSGTIDARDFKTMRDNMPLLEEIDLSGISIVEYNGAEGTSIWGNTNYLANEIPEFAFTNNSWQGKTTLKTIKLPESVTEINVFAFANCINLSSINLPSSLSIIEEGSFQSCEKLTSLVFLEGVTSIGYNAFGFCVNLSNIEIPATVSAIGDYAFRSCTGPITVDAANANFSSLDGVLFNKDFTKLMQCTSTLSGNYTIPSSVKTIGFGAFWNITGISRITIPEGVISINSGAFYNCTNLTSVVIPSTVNNIGYSAFAYSYLLDSIYSYALTPVDLSSVNNVFDGIDKTNCTLFVPFGSASAYRAANQWGDFTDIVEMDGFYPSTTSVSFSNMASTIKLFIGSSVSWSAESSESWLTISPLSAPGSDSLTIAVEQNTGETRTATITLHPDGLPDKTISVTQYGITLVTAGNLAAVLGDDLSTTKELSLSGTIDARDFKTMRDNMPLLEVIDLSGVSIVEYSGTEGTSNWGNTNYQANEVPQHGLYYKSSIKTITLPESATTISDYALSGCENLSTLDLPSTLIGIKSWAFAECDRLVSVEIPEGVTTIQPFTFYACDSLKTVTFPTTITNIAEYAFAWCYNLKDIFIPSSVTTIDHYVFQGCAGPFTVDAANTYFSSLEGVLFNKDFSILVQYPGSLSGNYSIPTTVVAIGFCAFGNTSSISRITIPEGVTAIFGNAFINCSNLTSLVIPSSVSYIGPYAFAACTAIDSIYSYSTTPVDLSSSNFVFDGIDKTNCTLFVPYGTATAYRSANQWGDFSNIVEMDGFLVEEKEVNLSSMSGSNIAIPIKANVDWTVSSTQSWLTADPLFGNGNADITLTAISENLGEKRYATITFSSSGLPDQTITVSQNSRLEVSPASVIINAPAGSSATLTVTSSLPWTATADQSWISVIPSNGFGNSSIVIIADENTGSVRDATVTISTPGLANRIISVKQIPNYVSDVALKYTAAPIEIDGAVEDLWNEASSQSIDIPYRLETPTVTATWKALYDDQNFYVLVTVDDDNHWPSWEAAGDSWLYDKPEVYWDVNETLDDGLGAVSLNGHYQLSDGFVDGGYDTPHSVAPMGVNPGGTYAYSLVGEGYVYEMAVPLKFLKDKDDNAITAQTYYPIGFDVTVVDQDEGITTTRQRCSWKNDGSIDESWNNMDNCGTVSFGNPANTNNRPVANAGSDQFINAGDLVTLDGSLSSDANLDPLSFKWFAPNGITLNNTTLQNPEFIAPDVDSITLFPILLIVSDGSTYSITDTVVITVQKGIPESFALSDTSITTGIATCFNASQTITLAGSGTTVLFESGSIVDLVAGQSIHFLPGFHAQNGSWMDARITTDGSFCDGIILSPVIQPEMNYSDEKSKEIEKGIPKPEKLIKLYPNPNNGRFTLEIENFNNAVVSILSLSGNKIIQINTNESNLIPINIPNLPKGIYFLSAYDKQQKIVKKFIVN